MKNIHILPTDKPSRLHLKSDGFYLTKEENSFIPYSYPQNIYITSDEEIKEEQNYIEDGFSGKNKFKWHKSQVETYPNTKKDVIVLTDDKDLIKDGVQAIDDDFLEWFVKNPSCEFVEVDYRYDTNLKPIFDSFGNKVLRIKIPTESENLSQIIIPKEEAKQVNTKQIMYNVGDVIEIINPTKNQPKLFKTHKVDIDFGVVYYYELNGKEETIGFSYIKKVEPKQETLEEVRKVERTELFNSIFSVVKQIPRKDVDGDAMDAPSCAYEIEQLFYKWQQEQDNDKFSGGDVPNNLESVLAKITHQNDLGLSQWHEVVYYDNETEKWCCYSGSKTFQDGERVVDWKYCKDLL